MDKYLFCVSKSWHVKYTSKNYISVPKYCSSAHKTTKKNQHKYSSGFIPWTKKEGSPVALSWTQTNRGFVKEDGKDRYSCTWW